MKTKTKPKTYRCDTCGRVLKDGHWVYSRFRNVRYCLPGKGCQK